MEKNFDDNKNHSRSIIDYLIIVWFGLMGADRIDLFCGDGYFIFTPFLFLSLILVFFLFCHFLYRKSSSFSFNIKRSNLLYIVLLNLFLILTLNSIIFGADVGLGLKRFFLLCFIILFNLIILSEIKKSPKKKRLIVIGAMFGIIIGILFSISELIAWTSGNLGDLGFINIKSHSIGSFFPRLSGMSKDPNRGGLLFVIFSFFLLQAAPKTKFRNILLFLASVFTFLTLSRSAIASLIIMWGSILLKNLKVKMPSLRTSRNIIVVTVVLVLVGLNLFNNVYFETALDVEKAFGERLSLSGETSGGYHFELVKRGFEVSFDDFKNFFFGIGFGSSYTVLDDFFGGHKYGNFHSLFISILVETGIFAFMIFTFLLIYPILYSKKYIPLLLTLIFFNIFYQLTLEPIFWFCLFIIWNNINLKELSKE